MEAVQDLMLRMRQLVKTEVAPRGGDTTLEILEALTQVGLAGEGETSGQRDHGLR
jgi:hypothetical protein